MNAKDHMRITQFTLENFSNSFSQNFNDALKKKAGWFGTNKRELIQGTADEDGFTTERATNWHFYRKEDDYEFLQPFKGSFNITYHPSSRRILKIHNGTFLDMMKKHQNQGAIDYEKLFNLVGRIIHHAQDMSTPSHLVPVFHGPEIFKDFTDEKDTYEEFSKDHLHEYIMPKAKLLKMLSERTDPTLQDRGFLAFYDHAAERNIQYLSDDSSKFLITIGGENKMVSCNYFWEPYNRETDLNQGKQNRGFGKYGLLEKHFGEESTTLDIQGKEAKVKFSDYQHIFIQFVSNAIADTLMCLKYVDKCYSGELVVR